MRGRLKLMMARLQRGASVLVVTAKAAHHHVAVAIGRAISIHRAGCAKINAQPLRHSIDQRAGAVEPFHQAHLRLQYVRQIQPKPN